MRSLTVPPKQQGRRQGSQVSAVLRDTRGSVTVEAALTMSVLVIVAAGIIAGVVAVASYLQAVHTAGAAARAHALGVSYSPPRGTVTISEGAGVATATVRIPTPLGAVGANAVFPMETQ